MHVFFVILLAAGTGLFLTYATYMTRRQGAVKMGTTVPIINNSVRCDDSDCVMCDSSDHSLCVKCDEQAKKNNVRREIAS